MTSDNARLAAGQVERPLWQQHEMLSVVVINLRLGLRDALEFKETTDPERLEILLNEVDAALAAERNKSYQQGFADGKDERAASALDQPADIAAALEAAALIASLNYPDHMAAHRDANCKTPEELHVYGAAASMAGTVIAKRIREMQGNTLDQPPPDEEQLRCNICGFIIDRRFEATKPTIEFTMAGRTKPKVPDSVEVPRATLEWIMKKTADKRNPQVHFVCDKLLKGEGFSPLRDDAEVARPAQVAQGGWQLVPKEPTQKMCEAGDDYMPSHMAVAYKAMLGAAPRHPDEKTDEELAGSGGFK